MSHYSEIKITDSLTYDTVKPIVNELASKFNEINYIKCEGIKEIDITGIQFLLSVRKYSKKIEIITDFSDEIRELVSKTGFKL